MVFEDQVDRASRWLEEEVGRRKSVEDDPGWLLHKGVICVVDKVVESSKFAMGVKPKKMVCMAAGVENGKQEVQVQVVTGKFVPGEAVSTMEHTQAMHATVKVFMEIDFSSYLHLGELNMACLHQLCDNSDVEDSQVEGGSSNVGASPTK